MHAANEAHDPVWAIAPIFVEGAEWADAHPKSPWVSVGERLPEYEEDVLVCDNTTSGTPHYLGMCFGHRTAREDVIKDANGFAELSHFTITHWMPIPPLPKEK